MLIHPVSRYNAYVGVESGTDKLLFNNVLSNTSRSSRSALVNLYHISEFVKIELRKVLSLNKKIQNAFPDPGNASLGLLTRPDQTRPDTASDINRITLVFKKKKL